MKELQLEDGNTQNSIENIDLLVTDHGSVRFLIHHIPTDGNLGEMTFVVFQDGFNHTATGFSTYFGADECQALERVIKKYLARYDITFDHIVSWERGSDHMILHGQGKGEEIHNFSFSKRKEGIISCKRMEVW